MPEQPPFITLRADDRGFRYPVLRHLAEQQIEKPFAKDIIRLLDELEAAPPPLDVDRLTEALHKLHSLEFWKWWEPQPDGGAIVRRGTSPDFAKALAAAYDRAQSREGGS